MDATGLSALNSYAQARPATRPDPHSESPGAALRGAVADFATTLKQGDAAATAAMTGDADPHALVQALVQTELAVEAAVTVRNKVVEAYQEILRMPV